MPIFDSEYLNEQSDVLGYHNPQGDLVAFSLITKFDQFNVEAVQFAWNYQQPDLQLGIRSLENECARYRRLGYHYLYLGLVDDYKHQFDGFELVGPLI
jgi:arginyl-tRNA--protein-N-Asp/Glu arginylyltransferase